MEFTYRRQSCRDFPGTIEAVERAIASTGFIVVQRHDLQARLAAKGFQIQPLLVLHVSAQDDGAHICNIHIYAEGEGVWIAAIRPTVLWSLSDAREDGIPAAEAAVTSCIDAAAE